MISNYNNNFSELNKTSTAFRKVFKKSINEGDNGEDRFQSLAAIKGFDVRKSNSYENISMHIDFHISKGDKSFTVDVKAMKRVSRTDTNTSNESVWIEFHNVQGKNGWIYGEQDCIAFEFSDNFIVVKRASLLNLVNSLIDYDLPYVISPKNAMYRLYQRKGRKDCISIIKKDDLMKIKHKIWTKH